MRQLIIQIAESVWSNLGSAGVRQSALTAPFVRPSILAVVFLGAGALTNAPALAEQQRSVSSSSFEPFAVSAISDAELSNLNGRGGIQGPESVKRDGQDFAVILWDEMKPRPGQAIRRTGASLSSLQSKVSGHAY